MKPTNCVNCGAILQSRKCEYCGTEYSESGIFANFGKDDYFGTMKLGDEEIKVYISHMESNLFSEGCYRDSKGMLHRGKKRMIRKFTVIEY